MPLRNGADASSGPAEFPGEVHGPETIARDERVVPLAERDVRAVAQAGAPAGLRDLARDVTLQPPFDRVAMGEGRVPEAVAAVVLQEGDDVAHAGLAGERRETGNVEALAVEQLE